MLRAQSGRGCQRRRAGREAGRRGQARTKKRAQLAMIDERRAKPLQLRGIEFLNTTKTGTALSGPATSLQRVEGAVRRLAGNFENRLYKLETGQYRVDAAYIAPDGRTLGSVNDIQHRAANHPKRDLQRTRRQLARRRVSAGQYTVNFYLNGQYFGAEEVSRGRRQLAALSDFARRLRGPARRWRSWRRQRELRHDLIGPTIATGTIERARRRQQHPAGVAAAPAAQRLPARRDGDSSAGLRRDADRGLHPRQPCPVPGAIRHRDVLLRRPPQLRPDQRDFLSHAVGRARHLDDRHQLNHLSLGASRARNWPCGMAIIQFSCGHSDTFPIFSPSPIPSAATTVAINQPRRA